MLAKQQLVRRVHVREIQTERRYHHGGHHAGDDCRGHHEGRKHPGFTTAEALTIRQERHVPSAPDSGRHQCACQV